MPDFSYENAVIERGDAEALYQIAGVDEAGRGPLAGPVSAAAVVLPEGFQHELLDDSKKLSEKKRERIFEDLMSDVRIRWAHSFVDAEEIDTINILRATHTAMARAVEQLQPSYCLIDGLAVPNFPFPSEGIVKGDGKSLNIAAASIIAKVLRDRKMLEYAEQYPEYGFEKHKGYGTKYHLEALQKYGSIQIHRKSFAPVAQLTLSLD